MAVTSRPLDNSFSTRGAMVDDDDLSLIFSFLPQVVRRSVPKVRSLRRSIGGYGKPIYSRAASPDSASSSSGSRPRTPPPAYQEGVTPLTAVLLDEESISPFDDARPALPTPVAFPSLADESGIRWKYATQGLHLLTLAGQEASGAEPSAGFSRQLYLDATSYLLRGVPEDLSDEETIRLRAAVPSCVTQGSHSVSDLARREELEGDDSVSADYEPTALHRLISMTVLQAFLLFSFLWPYFQVLVKNAYEYERTHHISERVANQTWCAANSMTKVTVAAANMVCGWNDGQVGQTLEAVAAWWIQSVAGGVCEGFGSGMEVLGVKPNMQSRRRAPRRSRA